MKIRNINKILHTAFVAMAGLLFAACHGHQEPAEPTPPAPPADGDASRTVLVYIVATNNLGSASLDNKDLREMQEAASQGALGTGRLLAYHAAYNGDIVLKEITANGIDTLKVYEPGTVSVSGKQMKQVISDMKELAPAKDYGLVLWSHASGWLQDGLAEDPQTIIPRSYGQDNSKKMNITTLESALRDEGFSFIYFDCCYMGSVETLYQLRDVAPVVVAAPTEIHLQGMPYHLNVPCFFADTPDMMAAAANSFNFYYESYSPEDCPLSFSVVDMTQLDDLADITQEIYHRATEYYPEGYTPQRLTTDRICYYYDLEDYVKTICNDSELWNQWQQVMERTVLYKAHGESIWGAYPLDRFGGLSTYIPTSIEDFDRKGYKTLDWYKDVASYLFDK